MSILPLWAWILFYVLVFIMLIADLKMFGKKGEHEVSIKEALKMTFVMGGPRFIIQQRVWVPRGLAVQMPVRIRNRQTRLLAQRQPGTSINTLGSYAPR